METVGRSWYVQVTEGRLSCWAEVGYRQLGHPSVVWDSFEVAGLPAGRTERMVVDALYDVLLEFMERRSDQG